MPPRAGRGRCGAEPLPRAARATAGAFRSRPRNQRQNPTSNASDALHTWLDRVQSWTPEFVRAAVRPLYLNLFYRRVFPEYARRSPRPHRN